MRRADPGIEACGIHKETFPAEKHAGIWQGGSTKKLEGRSENEHEKSGQSQLGLPALLWQPALRRICRL